MAPVPREPLPGPHLHSRHFGLRIEVKRAERGAVTLRHELFHLRARNGGEPERKGLFVACSSRRGAPRPESRARGGAACRARATGSPPCADLGRQVGFGDWQVLHHAHLVALPGKAHDRALGRRLAFHCTRRGAEGGGAFRATAQRRGKSTSARPQTLASCARVQSPGGKQAPHRPAQVPVARNLPCDGPRCGRRVRRMSRLEASLPVAARSTRSRTSPSSANAMRLQHRDSMCRLPGSNSTACRDPGMGPSLLKVAPPGPWSLAQQHHAPTAHGQRQRSPHAHRHPPLKSWP